MQSQKEKYIFKDIMLEEANNNFKNKDKYNILNVVKVREILCVLTKMLAQSKLESFINKNACLTLKGKSSKLSEFRLCST
jgi:hypothetical protein